MKISVKNTERAAALLARPLAPAIQNGAIGIAAAIQTRLAPYPAPSRRRQPPRSAAQRRAVFALIAAGQIPYKRTGQLGHRWNIRPTTLGAILENRRDKAALVYGRRHRSSDQARYHRGTWPDVDSAVAVVVSGPAQAIMQRAIEQRWIT